MLWGPLQSPTQLRAKPSSTSSSSRDWTSWSDSSGRGSLGHSALRLGGLWFSGVGRKVLVIVLATRLASSGGGVVTFIHPSASSSIRGALVRAVLASNVRVMRRTTGLGRWGLVKGSTHCKQRLRRLLPIAILDTLHYST